VTDFVNMTKIVYFCGFSYEKGKCSYYEHTLCRWENILETLFSLRAFFNCICLACIDVILCVFVYLTFICGTLCVFVVCSYFRCRIAC